MVAKKGFGHQAIVLVFNKLYLVQVGNDVLAAASQALDIAWTVKDGLLFHQIASIITAAVPTIFVYDGTSSPYKALQELASYQGVGPGKIIEMLTTSCLGWAWTSAADRQGSWLRGLQRLP